MLNCNAYDGVEMEDIEVNMIQMKGPKNNVVLIGFMGCGKTTIGTKLAFQLKQECLDTDKLLEKKSGKSISTIFEEEGEEVFRQMETRLLRELIQRKRKGVFSSGGGTPVRTENRTLLKELGGVVYLRIKPETVYERLKGDVTRPLLRCENPWERIKRLMQERAEAYSSCADVIVDVDDKSMDDIMSEIVFGLRKIGR